MNYSSLFEMMSKAAAGVGVILGLSYVSGFFKSAMFYHELQSGWILQLIDIQGHINKGLPLVVLDLMFMFLFFFFARYMRAFRFLPLFVVVVGVLGVGLAWCIDPFDLQASTEMRVAAFLTAGVAMVGSCTLAWLAHQRLEGVQPNFIFVTLGLAMAFCLAPGGTGYIAADDLKHLQESAVEIIDEQNDVLGLLVSVVGEKYIMLDCNVMYQMRVVDMSVKVSLRQSSRRCGAIY